MNKWCEKEIFNMIKLVAKAGDTKEVIEVFDKILTPREINDMARRLAVLKMIKEGKSYQNISMSLGMSSATISRISSKIGFGFRRCDTKILGKKREIIRPRIKKSKIKYKGAPTYKIEF